MDIKEKIAELVQKITGNKDLLAKFKADPIGTVKGILGNIDLSNDQLSAIVDGVKAKINLDAAGDLLGGLFGKK
ncbi:MAG: hypothetical protein IJR51_07880 [Clostridia bacterium]|nr:hypothetical protein [Clostridia bacterium]MBR5423920.1 hypothetical protein [Clostridia bacterium]